MTQGSIGASPYAYRKGRGPGINVRWMTGMQPVLSIK